MLYLRALAVWLIIIAVETVHGILRTLLLAPVIGDFRARQVGVLIGSILILIITFFLIKWLDLQTVRTLMTVGFLWVALTVLFEIVLGLVFLGLDWNRILSDYDIRQGGLMSFGLLLLLFTPLVAKHLRKIASH